MQNNPFLSRIRRDVYYDPYDPDAARAQADAQRLHGIGQLRQSIQTSDCKLCPLHKDRGSAMPVPGEGRGRVMLIGHRIGKNEANSGRPSIGDISVPGFSLLLEAIAPDIELSPLLAREACLDFCYVTNHARCSTKREDPPLKARKDCSKAWLVHEIRRVDPVIIVFWHRETAKNLIDGDLPRGGVVFEGKIFGQRYPCMIMNHPAIVFQKPTYTEAVKAQYRSLACWLYEKGYLSVQPPACTVSGKKVDHRLVTTREELRAAVADLWENPYLALDTETAYKGQYGHLSKHEKAAGALLWQREGFDIVTCQIAGLAPDGDVQRTYTICAGFLDRSGELQHELTKQDLAEALDTLLAHQIYRPHPQTGQATPIARLIFTWNMQFDCPVMTRAGVDLLGWTHRRYPIAIRDGMLHLARLNEHLSDIASLSLGAASQLYLGETKESFDKYFKNPNRFRYLDIFDLDTQRLILGYTGEDPRKTLLTSLRILAHIDHHVRQIESRTSKERTSLPTCGFGPFPRPGVVFTQSRLRDVAIPMDHQMVPILSQMTAVGFRFDTKKYKEQEVYVQRNKLLLMQKLRDLGFGSVNPDSDRHLSELISRLIGIFARGTNEMIERAVAYVQQTGHDSIQRLMQVLAKPLGIEAPTAVNPTWRVSVGAIKAAYEQTFGELTAEQKTIEKFLDVFVEGVYLQLRGFVMDQLPPALRQELERRDEQHLAPFIDYDTVKEVFDTIFLYKRLGKIWSTYFVRFYGLADTHGVFNPEFKLTDTVSGRLSGNFQNVPRGNDELKGVLQPLDVRQFIYACQADDLNRFFRNVNLRYPTGSPVGSPRAGQVWQVREEPYVLVTADYAAMEDRMAYALTGDRTKARLLANSDLDTHFYNAAFLFGHLFAQALGADMATEEGVMRVYEYLKEDPGNKGFKKLYRTPVKTIHYAKTYGAGAGKIHGLIYPIFMKAGIPWTEQDTKDLVARYAALYEGVEKARNALIEQLEEHPFIEYPIFGTLRHAETMMDGTIMKGEHLSVANALNQGTCAYLAKYAMLRMRTLIQENARRWNLLEAGGDRFVGINIQVHDEIGVLCPASLAHEVAACLESAMKIIVGPPVDGPDGSIRYDAFFDDTIADAAGETGWLYLPDPAFPAAVLFDAEAEVKRTISKLGVKKDKATGAKIYELLPDGQPNLYDLADLRQQYPDAGIQEACPLHLGRDGFSNELPGANVRLAA